MVTNDERIVLATLLGDKCNEVRKDMRANMDAELLDAYEASGIKQRELRVNGKPVGLAFVSHGKAKPAIRPGYEDEAIEFLGEFGLVECKPCRGWESAFLEVNGHFVHRASGQLVDFLEVAEQHPRVTVRLDKDTEGIAREFIAKYGDLPVYAITEPSRQLEGDTNERD